MFSSCILLPSQKKWVNWQSEFEPYAWQLCYTTYIKQNRHTERGKQTLRDQTHGLQR